MTTIQIDLAKNPDVAALVADKQPGDEVYGRFTVKAQDAQTLDLRIEQFSDDPDELDAPGANDADAEDATDTENDAPGEDDTNQNDKAEPAAKPRSMGRDLADKLMAGDSAV